MNEIVKNIVPSKILVTGGLGYIGSHTSVELIQQGFEIIIVDDLSNSSTDVLEGIKKITGISPEFIKLDLRDKKRSTGCLKTIRILAVLSILQPLRQWVRVSISHWNIMKTI